MSQLVLAGEAEISTRHLSFVENGRSQPSRQMILLLSSALEIPFRERNTLLQAAGFAPVYREFQVDEPQMAPVRRALDFLLRQAEPYGAAVVDRQWNALRYNRPMATLMALFLGADRVPEQFNLMEVIFDPKGFRPYIKDFEQLASALIDRLHRQAILEADPRTEALLDRILAYPGVPEDWQTLRLDRPPQLLVPLEMEKDGLRLSLFTTLTIVGTAADITTSELAIEHYFPADDATDQLLRSFMTQRLSGLAVDDPQPPQWNSPTVS
jgi:transcriptional regulator with XRE-family HTH domain